MSRLLAIPATWSAIVVIPILVGETTKSPPAPEPRQASLVVKASGDEGRSKPIPLLVRASGLPPASTTLTSADGLQTATAKAQTAAACTGAPVRSTAYDGDASVDWCLLVTGLPRHDEVVGVVKGTAGRGTAAPTALSLTVDHRDALRWWPAIIIAAGLLGSVLLTLLLNALAGAIRGNRVDRLTAQNRHAARNDQITGLGKWVETLRENGMADADVLALLEPLVTKGPSRARRSRGSLSDELKGSSLAPDIPVVEAARAEARRETNVLSDFYGLDGTAVIHPAEKLLAAIRTLTNYQTELERIAADVGKLKASCQGEPIMALDVARVWLSRQRAEDSFDELEKAVAAADETLVKMLADGACIEPSLRAAAETPAAGRTPPAPALAHPFDLGAARAIEVGLGALTWVAIAIAVGFAAVTVYVATYDPNATFGTWEDYFKLASAALAAGAAGTVAGLLAPWGPATPAPAD